MIEAQREAYKEEAYELLAELEVALLALEETPDDRELIGRVFRALHTIKGSGAMFGFDDIAAFTHEVETIFDQVRNGIMAVSKELVDLTLATGDQISRMLEGADGDRKADPARSREIVEALRNLMSDRKSEDRPAAQESMAARPEAVADSAPQGRDATYRISLRLHPDVFLKGTNPILLLNELRALGECRVIAHTTEVPDLDEFNPEECRTYWDIILTTAQGVNAIRDVFIFVEDDCELKIEVIDDGNPHEEDAPPRRLGEILVDRGHVSREDLHQALGEQKRVGELLIGKGLVPPTIVESALAEQEHVQALRKKRQQEEHASSVRVPAERLDQLVNLVGELVTVQARLTQTTALVGHADLLAISEEVERLTAELRDNAMSIRMLPIGTTFSKFKRLVRDLSIELKKDMVLVTEGAETELDKTVIERLNDPLVHLIRNSIDHGIESPDVREAAGKSRQGTVRLSAVHSGAHVLIKIEDDGAGLDTDAIRAKAVDRGLISADAELTEKEIYGLIFAPGFSTAEKVTSVSGRGVGMDVVKRGIESLRGSIDIASRKGAGTVITLKLPLTLAIIEGLLVEVGGGHYVLPLSIVEECVELTRDDVTRAHGRHVIYVRGEIVPYVRLREHFRINGGEPDIEQIVIAESGGGKVGFAVDKVIGEHQTVLKNLGRYFRNVETISGATILGDGTVALIVDVSKLVEGVAALETEIQ